MRCDAFTLIPTNGVGTGDSLTQFTIAPGDQLIADRGYDSDPLRQRLHRRGVTAIIPYRNWNLRRRYDDGRHLRRYRRRWIIERTFAWLHSFRRLLVRHERFTSMYCSLLYFAAALIALRRF